MEMCTDKAVVRTPSAPTPSTAIPQILRTVGAPEGALLGASNPRSRLTVHSTSPTPATAQALINCGHIYHLSCARRWFQTKGKSERGRPAHAPCPKCKEPYDMGSAVTVFMDVPKDERGEILFSPTPFPTRAGRGDVPDDVPDDDGVVVLDSPRDGADRSGDDTAGAATGEPGATRREVASLRRDLRREQTRAREADDRAARAEMAAERAERLEEERDALQTELARRESRENNALFEARTAKAKAKKASDELSSRLAEFQRAQSKLAYVENQRRLERDLNEGVSMAEAELLARFRREEPRSAVETLCRSLAGKNRQLARQIDEYGKLVRRVKQLERGVERGGGGAPVAGSTGAGSNPTGSAKEPPSPERVGKERTGGDGKDSIAAGGRLDRSKRRAWGADDDDIWDDVAGNADADDALRLRRPLRDANGSTAPSNEKDLAKVDFSKGLGSFGATKKAKGLGAFDDHGLGRVSRGASGKNKRARGGASGEELLDDILSGLDLPAKGRGEEKVRKPTSSGGDFGSFSRRFGSAAAATAEGSGADGGSFVIHGADGRGGRTKVIRAAGSAR